MESSPLAHQNLQVEWRRALPLAQEHTGEGCQRPPAIQDPRAVALKLRAPRRGNLIAAFNPASQKISLVNPAPDVGPGHRLPKIGKLATRSVIKLPPAPVPCSPLQLCNWIAAYRDLGIPNEIVIRVVKLKRIQESLCHLSMNGFNLRIGNAERSSSRS